MKLELKPHSKFSASSLSRIVACPGSVALSSGVEDKTSEYAAEGTVAHEVAEMAALGKRFRSMLGKVIEVPVDNGESYKIKVDEDMIEGAEIYKKLILNRTKGLKDVADVLVEESLDMSWIYPEFGGTGDCIIVIPFEKMSVIDYKYGSGVEVDPVENDQMMAYALGALGADNKHGVVEVELVIVQPRKFHPDGPVRSWTVSADELYRRAREEYKPAFLKSEAAEPVLNVTDKGCQWCPAKKDCPEIRKQAFAGVKIETNERNIPVKGATLPSVKDLTPAEIGRILEMHKVFVNWIDQVKDEGLRMLRAGEEVPGMKLVKSKTIRSWADPIKAISALSGKCNMLHPPKPLSPAQAEKAIKEAGYKKAEAEELVKPMVTQEVSTTFAPNSDRRPAYNLLEDAREAFKSLNASNDDIFS